MKTIQELIDHAFALATAFGVHLELDADCPPEFGVAGRCPCGCGRKFVIARRITDETSYAVVLHELGHCCSPLGDLRASIGARPPAPGCHPRERHQWMNLMLEEERAAWEWARHYALYWSAAMTQVEQFAFGTYLTAKKETR